MEIRVSVTQYVHDRIVALRQIQDMWPESTDVAEDGSSAAVNEHPDVLAHIHAVKVREKLARKAARAKAAKESAEAAKEAVEPVEIVDAADAAEETAAPAVVENAEEETERLAEERENERALKGKLDGGFKNVSVIRANAMKHLPNFFEKGQVGLGRIPYRMSGSRLIWPQLARS